jgi:hypothetical protein
LVFVKLSVIAPESGLPAFIAQYSCTAQQYLFVFGVSAEKGESSTLRKLEHKKSIALQLGTDFLIWLIKVTLPLTCSPNFCPIAYVSPQKRNYFYLKQIIIDYKKERAGLTLKLFKIFIIDLHCQQRK